jgi:hypothetical protein
MASPVNETDLLQETQFWSLGSAADLAFYFLFEI